MSFIADIFTGAGGAQNAANQAANQIQFTPYNISGDLGSVSAAGNSINLGSGALAKQYGGLFGGLATSLLNGAGAAGPLGAAGYSLSALDQALGRQNPLNPTIQIGTTPNISPTATPFMGLGSLQSAGLGNLDTAAAARAALGNFDPNAASQSAYQQLTQLAAPGEATAASTLLDRLYGSGRLGVNIGGRQQDLAELAYAQEQAKTGRALQAINLGQQEQAQLSQQAQGFGGLGASILGTAGNLSLAQQQALFGQEFQNAQNQEQLQLQQQSGLFNQLLQGAQFGQQNAFQRFSAAQQALGYGTQNQSQQIANALSLLGSLQGFQQSPLQLLGLSIGAGQANTEAAQSRAQIEAQAAQQRAQANSQFFSGLFSAIGGAAAGGAFKK